jgi:hypothetical protein
MEKKSNRRRFLKAAATAALPLVAAPVVAADEPPVTADQAMTAIIRQRFKHLTEDQLKAVRAGVQRGLATGETLKRTRLDPTDEPATIFVSDVAE